MAADPLEIIITAKDDTGRVLESVQNKFTGFGQEVEASSQRAFGRFGGAIEDVAIHLTRVLDPSLGRTLTHVTGLGESLGKTAGIAGTFAAGIGTVVVAAAAVAGLSLNQYIGTLSKLSLEQAKTNVLLDAMDFGGLASRAKGLDTQIRELQATFSIWQSVKNVTVGALESMGGALDKFLGKLPSDFVRRFGADQGAIDVARQALAGTNAAIVQSSPREQALIRAQDDILRSQTTGAFAALGAQEALAGRGTATGLPDIRVFLDEMDRRQQALSNELAAKERQVILEGDKLLAAAPEAARPVVQAGIQARREALGLTTAADVLRQQRAQGAIAIGQGLAAGEEDLSKVQAIQGTEADAVLAERQRAADLGQLDLVRQRAEILGEITPELNAQLAVVERNLLLTQAGLTEDEKKLINGKAQLALLEQQARLNPVAGLAAGFGEVAARSRELGTELRNFAQETSTSMGRFFSDNFFNLFTGKKGDDLGKQFGESLLRSVTDVIGRQLTGAISGMFAQALGGFRGFNSAGGGFDVMSLLGTAAGNIVSPTGAPAGTLLVTAGGQLAQITPSGAMQLVQNGTTVDPTQVVGIVGQAKTLYEQLSGSTTLSFANFGGSYLSAVSATPLSAIAAQGFSAAVASTQAGLALQAGFAAQGIATSFGAGTTFAVTGATASAPLTSAGLSVGGTTGANAGSTVGSAAAGVLAAVALGYTIYSGLSQQPTATNIALNTISGALSGAVIGNLIVPGIGAVIGAIVGGAAAGATTGLKAPTGKLSASERSTRIGEAAAGNLSGAIGQASSIEDLVTIFNTRWAPHGEVQIVTTYQGLYYWAGDYDDPAANLATPQLMIIPEFLDQLEIQVGQGGAPARRQDLIDAFRAKRDQLLETLSQVPIEILESDRAAGITRRTYLPFTQLYGLKPGTQQVLGSSELFRRDLGADDDTIAFLIQRIREVSVRKDIDISREDFLFR